jgi:hypothetical protein
VNGNCPKHLRSVWLAACSALVLAVGGCGGEDATRDDAPRIDAAAATQLANRSEEIASLIDAGDVCTAAHRADELLAAAEAEVENGTVPSPLAAELTSKAEALRNEVNCPAPPPPPVETEDDDDEDKKKGKGRKQDDDDRD